MPENRMAEATWNDILEQLRASEEERSNGVTLRSGCSLLIAEPDESTQQAYSPPKVMAALNPGPTAADIELLRQLDPHNADQWEPITSDLIAGWVFRLSPPFENISPFVFFAFHSPLAEGRYRVSVLQPAMEIEYDFDTHMTHVDIGGQQIPVIDPGGRPNSHSAADLAAVRAQAAKWMYYTACKMCGLDPGFSK
ncbi:hypothetical protein ACWCY6_42535 [Streptomyces sp. 900105755]